MPRLSGSCAWRRLMPLSRPLSGATPICSSSPAPGSSRRATRSGPSNRGAMTERYALIGNPVAHSQSPAIHARFAQATGQDIAYELIEAPLDGFERAVDEFRAAGGRGLNVTLPFKQPAFRYCGEVTARAKAAQAVNTLIFGGPVRGDNTDGVGLVRDLESNLGLHLRGKSVLLMGAGGAAQGVVGSLVERAIARLVIVNRTFSKAAQLAARFEPAVAARYENVK